MRGKTWILNSQWSPKGTVARSKALSGLQLEATTGLVEDTSNGTDVEDTHPSTGDPVAVSTYGHRSPGPWSIVHKVKSCSAVEGLDE